MRALHDERGAVRVEEVYDTDIADLWEACTTPERLVRWIATVSGDLSVGETAPAEVWSHPAERTTVNAPDAGSAGGLGEMGAEISDATP